MINLLSDQRQDDIRAARANVILLRYIAIIALALIFICGALYVSYTILQRTMQANEEIILSNDVKANVYSDTKAQVTELSSKLTEAKSALDQEVRYSQVLVKLGQLTPAGAVIDNLKLTTENFNGTPTDITVLAKSSVDPSALQTQFQNSPLFAGGGVTMKGTEPSGNDTYPVKISLTVTFNRTGI